MMVKICGFVVRGKPMLLSVPAPPCFPWRLSTMHSGAQEADSLEPGCWIRPVQCAMIEGQAMEGGGAKGLILKEHLLRHEPYGNFILPWGSTILWSLHCVQRIQRSKVGGFFLGGGGTRHSCCLKDLCRFATDRNAWKGVSPPPHFQLTLP